MINFTILLVIYIVHNFLPIKRRDKYIKKVGLDNLHAKLHHKIKPSLQSFKKKSAFKKKLQENLRNVPEIHNITTENLTN